jgi:phosphoribosyl-ATP pyrophosphohydrolase
MVLEDLYGALGHLTPAAHPRSFKLLQSGRRKLARKLIEEACEVTVEVVKHSADGVVRESADLLYQLVVLWFRAGIEPVEVWREMQSRAGGLGIAEKLPKTSDEETSAAGC